MSKILDLIVKVTDQASEQLEKIKGSTAGDGEGVQGVADGFLALAGQAAIAGLALQKAGKFVSDSMDDWQEYVFTVDNLSKAFGLSYEETEQLVFLADTFGVSNDALFSSLNKLAREGMGTGIEALANLREEFQAIGDPAERATYLFGMAGEQGQKVLGPMLSMSEIEWKSLIEGIEALGGIDQEMVDNARELELATQGIKQEWTELKIELANFAAPGLINLLTVMKDVMQGNFQESVYGSPSGYERMTGTQLPGGMMPEDYRRSNTESDRWYAIEESLRNLPNDIKDAVERSD